MTTIINASPTNGLVQTADGSGILKVQSNGVTTNALAWAQMSDSGSAVTINASYNVSSITYTASGNFTVNFTSAMTNSNYAVIGTCLGGASGANYGVFGIKNASTTNTRSTSAVQLTIGYVSGLGASGTLLAHQDINVAIFGN